MKSSASVQITLFVVWISEIPHELLNASETNE